MINKYIIILLFVLINNLTAVDFNYEEINCFPSSEIPGIEHEFGVSIGTPSAVNLNYIYHYNEILFKASGMYYVDLYGIQIDIGYKLYRSDYSYISVNLSKGYSKYPANNNIFGTELESAIWDYYAMSYIFSSKGFFIDLGASIGEGDFESPRINFQIGYCYQIN